MGKFILNKSFKGTFFNLGVGSTTLVAGDLTTAGFFGSVSQADFGITMTQLMSDLGITEGTAQNTSEPLLKFIHRGKIKYINKKAIRGGTSWDHIQSRLVANGGNVYGGATMTFGGNSYKVRLMRGWGQVSANTDGTGTPDYENGPLYTVNFPSGPVNLPSGVNWPTDTSDWNANSPNEWNTLIFPINENSSTQSQTGNVPDWASYSNSDLQIYSGQFSENTWTQESLNSSPSYRIWRGGSGLADIWSGGSYYNASGYLLRLVFELI